jgi:LysM repeat protein
MLSGSDCHKSRSGRADPTCIGVWKILYRAHVTIAAVIRLDLLLFCFSLLLIACVPPSTPPAPHFLDLTPYSTITPSPPGAGPTGLVAAETPLPSPTPYTYTVQVGDTLSEIAERFTVSLDDLQAANPEVSANSMSVGQVLKIPSDPANPAGEPTPTAVPFAVRQIECYPSAARGMWCFVLVHNDFSDFMENVSAQVTLVDSTGALLATQTALLPLNILPPHSSLPLTVFFAPDLPADAQPQVQILTAIRLLPDDARYLPAATQNVLVQVDWSGRSAQVSGQVVLPAESKAAAQIWVAAAAYDETGRIVGVRRWDWTGGLQPGTGLPFALTVASLAGEIERVELAVEARP